MDDLSELGEHDGLRNALIVERTQFIERGQNQRLKPIKP
jgi:hypothetical protein